MRKPKIFSIFTVIVFCFAIAADAAADSNRDQKQAELDAACEAARQKKLAPLRDQHVENCVKNGEQRDRQACERFYADFGAQSGNRAPLFLDLPECVEAFDFQNSQRQSR